MMARSTRRPTGEGEQIQNEFNGRLKSDQIDEERSELENISFQEDC
jgi:hypothetical protein